MDKKRILEILEGAKDDNGEIPMSLVRKAFEKIEEPCEDAVSRRAAIDAAATKIKKWNAVDDEGHHVGLGLKYTDVIDTLTKLPSVQPENDIQYR